MMPLLHTVPVYNPRYKPPTVPRTHYSHGTLLGNIIHWATSISHCPPSLVRLHLRKPTMNGSTYKYI